MNTAVGMTEREAQLRRDQINKRMKELDKQYAGQRSPEEALGGRVSGSQGGTRHDRQRAGGAALPNAADRGARRDANHIETTDYQTREIGGSRDFPMATRDALRSVDDLYERGELREAAALRLDTVIRRDKGGAESEYIAAVSDPDYLSAFPKMLSTAARRRASR